MKTKPGIGYHKPVSIPSDGVVAGKYVILAIALLSAALFIFSHQYIMIIWSILLGGFGCYEIYRIRKIKNRLSTQLSKISDYARSSRFTGKVDDEKISFSLDDENIDLLCSSDAINYADELIRTLVIMRDKSKYYRIRIVFRDKIYQQLREIPQEVATDMWTISQEDRAKALGIASPFEFDE